MTLLSENVKKLMAKNHMLPSDLGKIVGLNPLVIHRIASGELEDPKLSTLSKLALGFGISLSQLVGEEPLALH